MQSLICIAQKPFPTYKRRGGASVVFGAFGSEGRWFEPTSRHV